MTLSLNIIPNLPSIQEELITPIKTPNGIRYQMNPVWHSFFSQWVTSHQNSFSNEGVTVPNQTTSNIALLTNKNFALLGDNQLHQLKVILNGAVKTITTS